MDSLSLHDALPIYLHMGGRIGALSLLEGTTDESIAKDVAMHAAAVNPRYVSRNEVAEEEVNREREVLKTQALNEGKPEKIGRASCRERVKITEDAVC